MTAISRKGPTVYSVGLAIGAAVVAAIVALALLWPAGEARAAKIFLTERPQQNLSTQESDYLDNLEEEVIEDFEEAEFQHINLSQTRLSEEFKSGEDNYLVRAKFWIHPRGIKIKLLVLKVEVDSAPTVLREKKIWSYAIGLGVRNQDLENHLDRLDRELGEIFIPSVQFYMASANKKRLLANCIWADFPADKKMAKMSKFTTLRYHEKLTIALGTKYRIKGIERSEYLHICKGSKNFKHPQARAYDHVVSGFLTEGEDHLSVVLLWRRNDERITKEVELILSSRDEMSVTEEISRGVLEIAP